MSTRSVQSLKVIHFVHSASGYSGAYMQAVSLAEALKSHNVEQFFVTTGTSEDNVVGQDFSIYSLGFGSMRKSFRFFKVLLRVRPNIIHFHGADFLILLIARMFGRSIYWKTTLSGSDDFESLVHGVNGKFKRLLLRLIDCNNALTKQNFLANKRYLSEEKIVIIPNGVVIPSSSDLVEKENLVLVVGAVIPRKRVKEAVKFFKRNFQSDGYRLFIIGPADNSIEGFAQAYFSECLEEAIGSIEVLGRVDAPTLRSYYARAKYLLHFSSNEGMPNVVLEAMAWGVAPILAPMGGVSEELFGDVSCVQIVDEITINQERVAIINEADPFSCRKFVEERFGIDFIAACTAKIYRKLDLNIVNE